MVVSRVSERDPFLVFGSIVLAVTVQIVAILLRGDSELSCVIPALRDSDHCAHGHKLFR